MFDESERAARELRVTSRAVEVFEDESLAREWLNRSLCELGDQTPLQMSATEPGVREVERVLGRMCPFGSGA